MERIDPQPDIESVPAHPRRRQNIGKPRNLGRRIEDHMVRQMADFGKVFSLVPGAIRRDFAGVMFTGKFRFP